MYLDFFILILDYFKTLTKRVFIYEWLIPFIICIGTFCLCYFYGTPSIIENFNNNVIRLLAVLVGFSITIITILTTGHSRNLEEIKSFKTKVEINKKKISLFRLLIINFTYSVIIEVLLIVNSLLYPFVLDRIVLPSLIKYIGFSIVIALIVHVLLLTIRNLTDFCLVITKESK